MRTVVGCRVVVDAEQELALHGAFGGRSAADACHVAQAHVTRAALRAQYTTQLVVQKRRCLAMPRPPEYFTVLYEPGRFSGPRFGKTSTLTVKLGLSRLQKGILDAQKQWCVEGER